MIKEELTYVILGKQLIGDFYSKDFVDRAVTIMQQGYESDSLLSSVEILESEVDGSYCLDCEKLVNPKMDVRY
ncbi:TPA: hypothetical protein ACGZ9U_003477 [Elizabethkingia anophelis]|nr:hypothetical protein [Elizabethkingia anophelis]